VKKEQIDILREVFEEWLQIHDLDYDFWIYSGEEWRARGETVLTKAEAVLAFENQLLNILNYTGPPEVEEELQELAGGFGYYFEIGHHWNIGFYPVADTEPLPAPSTGFRQPQVHRQRPRSPIGAPAPLPITAPSTSSASLCVPWWPPDTSNNPPHHPRRFRPHRSPPSTHPQADSDRVGEKAGTPPAAHTAHE
jgi:hypothetical protein